METSIEAKVDNGILDTGIMDNQSDAMSLAPPSPPLRQTTSATPESTRSVSSGEESTEDNEEERVGYFLQCFSNIPMNGNFQLSNVESIHDNSNEDSIASFEGDHGYDLDMDEEYMIGHNNETQGEIEAVLVGSDDEGTTLLVPSLFNDDFVLQNLRTILYGTDQISIDGTANGSTHGSEGDRKDDQTTNIHQQRRKRKECHHDPMVTLFFKFFEFAQTERLNGDYIYPYFILNLFSQLSNIRSDLKWAQDAAHRKQMGKPYVSWADYYAKDRSQPWFTYAMMVIITFTMLWGFHLNDWNAAPMGDNITFGPSEDVLLKLGALKGQILVQDGKWWLLVTPIFLHSGVIHFTLNSMLFFYLGRTIERNHGWLHTALLFLSSGIVGNMISAPLQPKTVMVGSSGGIFGLLGACLGDIVLNSRFFFLVLEERAQKETLRHKRQKVKKRLDKKMKKLTQNGIQRSAEEEECTTRASAGKEKSARDLIVGACDPGAVQTRRRRVRFCCYGSLVVDLLFNLSIGLVPFVDNYAHLGGLLFGFFASLSTLRLLSASPFDYRKKQHKSTLGKSCHGLRIFALRCGGGISALCLVFIAVFFLLQSDGITSPCPSCRHVTCTAFPKPWKPNDPSNWWTCDPCDWHKIELHWQSTGFDQIIGSADVRCPTGKTIRVDISDKGYKEIEQVSQFVPNLCRTACTES